MSDQSITIKFKPIGDKSLINSINRLDAATRRLVGENRQLKNELSKTSQNAGLLDNKAKKLSSTQDNLRNKNRGLSISFATLRSQMLLYSFAMSMGIRQLIQFAMEAEKLKSVEKAFNTLSGSVNLGQIALNKLQKATDGTMSSFDLFQQANNAMILGVTKSSSEMAEMFDIAQRLGRALGRDTASSVESLITGIGRQSRLMLDNIGIIVRVEEAQKAYAKSLNISVDKLSDADKKQAFLNATMIAAREKVQKLGEETLNANDEFQELAANIENAAAEIGKFISPLLNDLAKKLNRIFGSDREERLVLNPEEEEALNRTRILFEGIGKALTTIRDNPALIFGHYFTFIGQGSRVVEDFNEKLKEQEELVKGFTLDSPLIEEKTLAEFKKVAEEGIFNITADRTVAEFKRVNEEIDETIFGLGELMNSGEFMDVFGNKFSEITDEDIAKFNQAMAITRNQLFLLNQQTEREIELLQARKDNFGDELGFLEAEINIMQKRADALGDTNEAKKLQLEIDIKQLELDKKRNARIIEETIQTNLLTDSINSMSSAITNAALTGSHFGRAMQKAIARIATEIASKAAIFSIFAALFPTTAASAGLKGGFFNSLKFALGLPTAHTGGFIKDNKVQKFATGGVVEGQDNVPILAQNGEFVMSRSAVESVGIETMNRINQTGSAGVTVNISGNVMSQDFVEGELAERIKEAVRKGSNFGML